MLITIGLLSAFCAIVFLSRRKSKSLEGENKEMRIFGRLEVIWTILNNLFHGRSAFHFQTLSNPAGPVAFMVGSSALVVINQLQVAQKAMKSKEWQNRISDGHYVHSPTFGKPLGLFFGGGEYYKRNQSIMKRALHRIDFFKPQQMQKYIWIEINELVNHLEKKLSQDGSLLSPQHMFQKSSLNIVWQVMFSNRFEYEDPSVKKIIEAGNEMNRLFGVNQWVVDLFPPLSLLYKPPFVRSLDRFTQLLSNVFQPLIEEKKAHIRTHGLYAPQDLTEGFLMEMGKLDTPDSFVTEDTLKIILRDLVFAGVDTTNSSLEFALLYIATNAPVYKKIMTEIDQVVGTNRLPCIDDRNKMIYTQATLLEVLRMGTVVSTLARSNQDSSELNSLPLPKGSRVAMKAFDIHHSRELWEDPLVFRPERFIGPDNNIINQNKIIPFGYGKRACTGETLARAVMFIFSVTLLQKFKFEVPSELPPPVIKSYRGLTSAPHPYFLRVTKRL